MPTFWDDLRNVSPGPNTMGPVLMMGLDDLNAEQDPVTNPAGRINVVSAPLGGGGYQLRKTNEYGSAVASVYWLPYVNHGVVSAYRDSFEKGQCDFFMTTGFSGCRFTVTPREVLHIAHSQKYQGEEDHTGPRDPATRRLSVSAGRAGDIQYGGANVGAYTRSLVFGMKRYDEVWVYKVLNTSPAPGVWATLL